MSINVCSIMGRLTADVELRSTQSSVSVCNFCVAVDRQYKKDEERLTDWIDCVAWRGTAEFVSKYFKKGDPIAVIGKIQTRNWEDQNGNKRKSTEIVVDEVSFVGSKRDNTQLAENKAENTSEENYSEDQADIPENVADIADKDLPF